MQIGKTVPMGDVTNPFADSHQLTLAEGFVHDEFPTESGVRGLQYVKGEFWRWWAHHWEVVPESVIENMLLSWSHNKYVVNPKDNAGCKPIDTWGGFLAHLLRGVKAVCECGVKSTPAWLRVNSVDAIVDLDWVVAFEDVCVDCKASWEKKEWVTFPRDERYFGSMVVPLKWNPYAVCPRWDKALDEWGEGDEQWGKLLRREFGMGLVPFRGHRRWFLHYGTAVGGKSLIERIRRGLMGERHHISRAMIQLAERFGLHSLVNARCLCVTELRDMEGKGQTEQISAVIKSTVGQDSQMFDIKYRADPMEAISPAMVVMLSNKIPKMSDTNRGLSSKMVMLPFYRTFEKGGDPNLYEKLMGELEGIAKWACEGACEVYGFGEVNAWAPIQSAEEDVLEFEGKNNEADDFLKWGFEKVVDGYVPHEVMWLNYLTFCRTRAFSSIGYQAFSRWLLDNTSWSIRKGRRKGAPRGFFGLTLKEVPLEVRDEEVPLMEEDVE